MNIEIFWIILFFVCGISLGVFLAFVIEPNNSKATEITWGVSLIIFLVSLSLVIFYACKWDKIESTPYEQGQILSTEVLENFKVDEIDVHYNNTSEETASELYIEGIEDYEYILIKYRIWDGNFYADYHRLELRKKEK